MRRKIKLAIAGITVAMLIEKCGTVISKMTGNTKFPDPTPSLAELTTAVEALEAATVEASGGDREAILIRKAQELVVANMLRTLAAYVTLVADGDGAMIASSGFELQRLPESQPLLSRPVDFKAVRGEHSDEVELSFRSVRNALSYVVEMTTGDPSMPGTEWTAVAVTTKVRVKFNRLDNGKFYYYRVKAVGRKNDSPYSDISMVQAAAA